MKTFSRTTAFAFAIAVSGAVAHADNTGPGYGSGYGPGYMHNGYGPGYMHGYGMQNYGPGPHQNMPQNMGPQNMPQNMGPQNMPQNMGPQNMDPQHMQRHMAHMQRYMQQGAMQDDPAIKVQAQLAGLRAFLKEAQNGPIDPKMALGYVEKQIAPDVDFETMTRMALGRMGARLSPKQRTQAQETLQHNFAAKIVEAMGDIRGTRVEVGNTHPGQSHGELVVPVRIAHWRGNPLEIDFRFYKTDDGWKVFDAIANGQSAVLFYRGWFARQMRG